MAKKTIGEKLVKIAFVMLLLVIVMLLISKYAEFGGKMTYEKILEKIAEIDNKYNMDFHEDYQYGMEYLWYKPRYPNPINPDDVPGIIAEFEKIKEGIEDDRPSLLLVDARINFLEAEKYFKLSKKYPLKGSVYDGFNCGDMDAIKEAVGNLNLSVKHGRIAIEALNDLESNYKKETDIIDISRYWIKSVNETFDELADKARKNQNTISYFCLNQTNGIDEATKEEFAKVKDAMKTTPHEAVAVR